MNKKRALAISFTFVGAVVGAGFSSGQEVWHFFGRHQEKGLLGIIVVGLIFLFFPPILFQIGKKHNIESYHLLFYKFLPNYIAIVFDLVYSSILLGSISVMLAGSGVIFKDQLGLTSLVGIFITLFFIFLVLYLRKEGILAVNSILIPFLLLITVLTVIKYLGEVNINQQKHLFYSLNLVNKNWFLDALLYASYNLTIAVALMIGILSKEDREDIIHGSRWGGIILFILNLFIFIGLINAFFSSPEQEIPMFYLAKESGKLIYIAYLFVLYFAMLSTAIVNYYALNKRLIALLRIKYNLGLILIMIFVLPLSLSGFSNLIKIIYPIFGYLGFFVLGYYIFLLFKDHGINK